MSLASALAQYDSVYASKVRDATWGHLAPRRHVKYRGHIVFAVGCYDDLNHVVIDCEFKDRKGKALDDSPWFYEHLHDFVGSDQNRGTAGNVYRFDGAFCNYVFTGTIVRLTLVAEQETR